MPLPSPDDNFMRFGSESFVQISSLMVKLGGRFLGWQNPNGTIFLDEMAREQECGEAGRYCKSIFSDDDDAHFFQSISKMRAKIKIT